MVTPLRFEPYESTTDLPNVIVDGSPNPSTVLTLTHWLTASEVAIASGAVAITEHPDVDLAVVVVDDALADLSGTRFAHHRFSGVHPMALHNATVCTNVVIA